MTVELLSRLTRDTGLQLSPGFTLTRVDGDATCRVTVSGDPDADRWELSVEKSVGDVVERCETVAGSADEVTDFVEAFLGSDDTTEPRVLVSQDVLDALLAHAVYSFTDALWNHDVLTDDERHLVSEDELADIRELAVEHLGTDVVEDLLDLLDKMRRAETECDALEEGDDDAP